jgi:hypothetical protein
LINKAKRRNFPFQRGTVVHHIVPCCIGGSEHSNNKVRLFVKEHCLVHLLLFKIYHHEDKLAFAAKLMYSVHSIKKYVKLIERDSFFIFISKRR